MTDENWKPLFRASTSTVTKVLRSPAFQKSRELSPTIAEHPDKLRALADSVLTLDHQNPPLAVIEDRIAAAVHFLRARAEYLEAEGSAGSTGRTAEELTGPSASAGVAAHQRLLIAGLHYLVTPVDLVPDFRPGGYVDDVLLLAWVFGVASNELAPYLTEDPDDLEATSTET